MGFIERYPQREQPPEFAARDQIRRPGKYASEGQAKGYHGAGHDGDQSFRPDTEIETG